MTIKTLTYIHKLLKEQEEDLALMLSIEEENLKAAKAANRNELTIKTIKNEIDEKQQHWSEALQALNDFEGHYFQ